MLNETASAQNAAFERLLERADFTSDPAFRASYLAHHLRVFLADQIRALRGELSQREFGKLLDKPQSVVSRLEDEEYGKVTLQTLIDIATKRDVGLLVRFVDFPTFLRETNDFSEGATAPSTYSREAVNEMLLARGDPQSQEPIMTEAPPRIWVVNPQFSRVKAALLWMWPHASAGDTEYIRADLAREQLAAKDGEIKRLRKIETAARNVAETINGGIVVCCHCGDQESTTDLDYARELYEALGIEEKKP